MPPSHRSKRCGPNGRYSEAQDRYSDIVRRHQRRAMRIAYHMLCDPADADEVVQDAFVKAYIAFALLPTTVALRNLVYSDPDQQLPRPDQNAQPPGTPFYVGPVLVVWAARFLGECCSGHDVAGTSSARTRTP